MPPSVKDGRIIAGRPVSSSTSRASSLVGDATARALQPDLGHCLLEQLSVLGLVDRFSPGPDQFHPVGVSAPILASDSAVFRPVCPPIVGRIASGFSLSMILATSSA